RTVEVDPLRAAAEGQHLRLRDLGYSIRGHDESAGRARYGAQIDTFGSYLHVRCGDRRALLEHDVSGRIQTDALALEQRARRRTVRPFKRDDPSFAPHVFTLNVQDLSIRDGDQRAVAVDP